MCNSLQTPNSFKSTKNITRAIRNSAVLHSGSTKVVFLLANSVTLRKAIVAASFDVVDGFSRSPPPLIYACGTRRPKVYRGIALE
jgi:hypothetical protein